MAHSELHPMTPALEALHAARTALTVVCGRVELAKRHAMDADALDLVMRDLASVPDQLEHVAAAVDRLAAVAARCESDGLLALVTAPKTSAGGQRRVRN